MVVTQAGPEPGGRSITRGEIRKVCRRARENWVALGPSFKGEWRVGKVILVSDILVEK